MRSKKYKNNKRYSSSRRKLIVLFAGVVIIIGSAAGMYWLRSHPRFDVPKDVSFGVWYPLKNRSYSLQENSLQYDKLTSTITFKLINKEDKNELTFVEQAVPENFAGAGEVFDKQVASLQQATKFESVNGQVAITRPLGNEQSTAIMRSQGTIVYVTSQKQFESDAWRTVFNSMELVK